MNALAAKALHQAARAAMARRDARAARAALKRLLEAFPEYGPGWLSASILELDLHQPARALMAVQQAMALNAGDAAVQVQQVRCLHAAGRLAEARRALATAEPSVAVHPHMQHELGNAAAAMGEHELALRLMSAARERLPEDPALAYNMAAVLRYLGRFMEAEACLACTIRHAPADYEAYLSRAQLRTQTEQENHVAELQHILSAGVASWAGEVQLRYALAKELEDLGRHKESFAHLKAGADLRRRHLQYEVADDIAAMEEIHARFGTSYLARAAPSGEGAGAIFVFGLPRSGTTLVDRILGCHRRITSLGELSDFPAAVIGCSGGPGMTKHALVGRAAETDAREIGRAYLARVASREPETAYFIDKLPMNYLYAGLIAAALPGARLVHVCRHKMANGYGMYKTLFQQGYPFSYDMNEIGRYSAAYSRLMAHWRDLLGPRLICVGYESLVAQQEDETRRLVAACGLEWDAACLTPHRSSAPSATQSAVQVRRPVHGEWVRLWRRYADDLAPLRAQLLQEGVPADELA